VIRKHRLPASWRHLIPGIFVLANVFLALATVAAWISDARSFALVCSLIWASQALMYGLASLAAAVRTSSGEGWHLLPVLPLVFATYHISYGVGFLVGIGYFVARRAPRVGTSPRLFSGLTR
jgi:hypothetical protein